MELFIISSNIRFSTHDDAEHAWPKRKNILAQLLRSYSPLLIGTQEGRHPQLLELAELLPDYQLVDQHREWIGERMYPCLFVKRNLSQVKDSGDFWLSETPHIDGSSSFESMFPRLCTWVKIELNGSFIYIFNTHLDHVQTSTRKAQAQVLCNEIKKINAKNLPMIILGDFNDSPDSPTRKCIISNFSDLKDDWNQAEESSHHPFSGHNPEGHRIDWILHTFSQRMELSLDKSSTNGIWPSDHFPLVGKLKL